MTLFKHIRPGELLPPFYGIAWVDFHTDVAICLPVPLNFLVGLGRGAWVFLVIGHRVVYMSPRAAYWQGRRDEHREMEGRRHAVAD